MMNKLSKLMVCAMALFLTSFQGVSAKPDSYSISYDGTLITSLSEDELSYTIDDVAVPGDEYSESFTFTNNHTHEVELFISSSTLQEYDGMFEFDIYKGDQLIIQKTLDSDIDTDYISLGNIEKDEVADFSIKVFVPVELDNTYNFADGNIEWKLSVEDNCPAIQVPNTGIYAKPAYIVVAGSCALAAAVLMISQKKGEKQNENKKNVN